MGKEIRLKNLLIKDIFLYKNVIFVMILYFIFMASFNITKPSDLLVYSLVLSLSSVFIALVTQVAHQEKNKGIEGLVTTSYTRKDIILSRYLFCLTVGLLQLVVNFIIGCFIVGDFVVFNPFILSFSLFLVFLEISLSIPFSFKVSMSLYCMIAGFIFVILELIIMTNDKFILSINFSSNNIKLSFLFILLAISFFITSFFLSEKIYLKKDL